jgi:hypothetical protein
VYCRFKGAAQRWGNTNDSSKSARAF